MTKEEKEYRDMYKMTLSEYSKELFWLDKKIYLSSLKDKVVGRKIKRNEVYKCHFGVGVGSEMDKNRPSVIIQVNSFNFTSGNTIVAPITHDKGTISCLVPIEDRHDSDGKLILDGSINVSNLMCVSKARLGEKIAELSDDEIVRLNNALYDHLSLNRYIKQLNKTIEKREKQINKLKEQRDKNNSFYKELQELVGKKKPNDILKVVKELIDNKKD